MNSSNPARWGIVATFAIAMAWVEAAVVFYLRSMMDRLEPHQPDPLPVIGGFASVELPRELATLVMLFTVGALAGRTWRARLGYAAIAFGVWDIFYYVFLKIICGWPHSLLDWDVLFLLPLPWWGPVLAPVLISLLMILWGTFASQFERAPRTTLSNRQVWVINMAGMALVLYVFMADSITAAHRGFGAIRTVLPERFNWPLFGVALALMSAPSGKLSLIEISVLLRGELEPITAWIGRWSARRFALHVVVIVVGAGLYGAAMGCWRDPQQALYVAIKFPLIILLTTLGNALLNAMLAPMLGLNIPFRQSFSAILMSFTIAAAILGAFSPLMAFMVWNAPPMSPEAVSGSTYSFIKLLHVAAIAFAGTMGNARLFQLLAQLGGSRTVARRVLFAWLAGNLFLGSQLSWILRPFIGSPSLPVEFFRATALRGNFYESVFRSLQQILQQFD